MPTIINDPYSGNIFGRIGQGLGKGLAEQLPKGIERGILSQGLKELEQRTDMTPLQQMAELYSLPGGTEAAAQVLPYLQAQAVNQGYLKQNLPGGKGQVASLSQSSKAGKTPVVQQKVVPTQRMLSTNYLTPSSPEDLRQKGAELFQENPLRYGNNVLKAEEQAASDDARRVAQDTANEKRLSVTEERFNKVMQAKLQKNGTETWGDVLGDLQNDFLNKAYDDTNLSPVEAANKYGQEALDFAKNKQNLEKMGGLWERMTTSPQEKRNRLDVIRDSYAKHNKLEEFKNELVSKGMDEAHANYLAFPIKENKELNNYVNTIEKGKAGFAKKLFKYESAEGSEPKIAQDVGKMLTQNVGKMLKNNDSLFSIALNLKSKGYDGVTFLNEIQKLNKEGKIDLTPSQVRELGENRTLKPTLDSILIFRDGGLDPLMEVK